MILGVTMTTQEIQAECESALADAGFAPEQVRFFHRAELGEGNLGAAWFRPHQEIAGDDRGFPGSDALRNEANREHNRNVHRITVPAEPSDPATYSGLVRHELEHARQWDAMLGIFDFHDFVEYDVLPEVAGGLAGCGGGLINTIPTEVDCNAAASVFLAGRFSPEEVEAVRDGPRRYLACSLLPPPPPETLPARVIAFAFVHRAAVERHAARRGFPVRAILSTVHPRAPELWARLEEGL